MKYIGTITRLSQEYGTGTTATTSSMHVALLVRKTSEVKYL